MKPILFLLGIAALAGCGKSAESQTAPGYDFSAMRAELFDNAWKTEGVVVLHEGKIVFEEYADGWNDSMRHITYSVSKSFGSALLGIAIEQGLIALEDSICQYLTPPEGADPTLCDTTIEHLVRMSSGLHWVESYSDPLDSNILPMLYGDEADMGLYAALQPREAMAGERWSYSSGDSNLLSRALRIALGDQDMRAWAKEHLFDRGGMTSAVFESDRSGTLVFSSSCFMTPRDMAKFGQLYVDDGMSGSTRLLPEGWVEYTKTPAPPLATPRPRDSEYDGGSYGAAFWLNGARADAPADTLAYPQVPADMFAADGHWGQMIAIIPSRKLVIARVGNDRDPGWDANAAIQLAVSVIDQRAVK